MPTQNKKLLDMPEDARSLALLEVFKTFPLSDKLFANVAQVSKAWYLLLKKSVKENTALSTKALSAFSSNKLANFAKKNRLAFNLIVNSSVLQNRLTRAQWRELSKVYLQQYTAKARLDKVQFLLSQGVDFRSEEFKMQAKTQWEWLYELYKLSNQYVFNKPLYLETSNDEMATLFEAQQEANDALMAVLQKGPYATPDEVEALFSTEKIPPQMGVRNRFNESWLVTAARMGCNEDVLKCLMKKGEILDDFDGHECVLYYLSSHEINCMPFATAKQIEALKAQPGNTYARTVEFVETTLNDLKHHFERQDENAVLALLDATSLNLDYIISEGGTMIHFASYHGVLELVKGLTERGARLDEVPGSVETTLANAVSHNKLDVVAYLLSAGANPAFVSEDGISYLHIALTSPTAVSLPIFQLLIEAGTPLDAQMEPGYSALHLAARYKKTQAVKRLCESGADIFAKGLDGLTALHFACEEITVESAGNFPGAYDQAVADSAAKLERAIEIVEILVEHGASVNAGDDNSETALSIAVWDGFYPLAEKLIELGADLKMNLNGSTLLHHVADAGKTSAVEWCLENGADPFAKNDQEETALEIAREKGNTQSVILLQRKMNALRPQPVTRSFLPASNPFSQSFNLPLPPIESLPADIFNSASTWHTPAFSRTTSETSRKMNNWTCNQDGRSRRQPKNDFMKLDLNWREDDPRDASPKRKR